MTKHTWCIDRDRGSHVTRCVALWRRDDRGVDRGWLDVALWRHIVEGKNRGGAGGFKVALDNNKMEDWRK